MLSHHVAMFGGYWPTESGDMKYLICQVTWQNYLIERSSNFKDGSSSCYVPTLPRLVVIVNVVVNICFFVT